MTKASAGIAKRKTLEEHIKECKSLVRVFFQKHNMFVIYIHRRRRSIKGKFSNNKSKIIDFICNVAPGLSLTSYQRILSRQGISPQEVADVYKILKVKQSPRIGCVVGYRSGDNQQWHVGWSLCNTKLDKFNRYEGIRRAILRAIPANEVYLIPDIPHTCKPYILQALARIERKENKQENQQ